MKKVIEYHNDYVYAALFFAVLSIVGSFLSLINIITLLLAYNLLEKAQVYSSPQFVKMTSYIFQAGLIFTLAITIFYLTIKL